MQKLEIRRQRINFFSELYGFLTSIVIIDSKTIEFRLYTLLNSMIYIIIYFTPLNQSSMQELVRPDCLD